MSFGNSGTFKNMGGHFWHQKKKKADTVTGVCAVPGTISVLTGTYYTEGPFIAETIIISNPTGAGVVYEIYDGATLLMQATIAANSLLMISPVWIKFFTNIGFDAANATVILTVGGFIP